LTGFTEDEILNIPFIELVYPEDLPMVIDRFTRRLRGDETSSSDIFRILRKDGGSFWVEINSVRTIWEERPAVMANIKDINERVESEKKVQESAEKYRSLVESTEDSIYLADRDYRYLFMNRKYLSRFDLPLDEVIGRGMVSSILKMEPKGLQKKQMRYSKPANQYCMNIEAKETVDISYEP
jgi:PAS domain S-box-containing protein